MIAKNCLLLLMLLTTVLGSVSCTLVKPVTGVFTHPVRVIGESFDRASEDEDDEDEHEDLPTAFALPVVLILLPAQFLYLSGAGGLGGLASGIVSDLNILTGNAEKPGRNWTRPFRTNARKPSD